MTGLDPVTALAAPVRRPNGKLYRPRKPPSVATYEDRDHAECVVVLRTHDIAAALDLAADEIACYDLSSDKARRDWWRLVPFDMFHQGCDSTWITDETRGVPCVVIPYDE